VTAFEPSPVRRPREQVEQQLREAILSGTFRQGEKLPAETQLARQFSVSRTTVREALRSLASSGLISKVPGVAGGSFVRSVDHRALESVLGESLQNVLRLGSITHDEVQQMRHLLELPAAALAAEHRGAQDLERLEQLLASDRPDLDADVHSAIAEASGNRVLASVVAALHRAAGPSGGVSAVTEAQHRAVVDAIRDGDPIRAADAMAAHLEPLRERDVTWEVGSPPDV
jgi:GntR family transcriptional regulator, transcriptional repressor for pyruvate dehydrogenase complex